MSSDEVGPETRPQRILEADDWKIVMDLKIGLQSLRNAQEFSVKNLGYDNTSTESFARYGLGLMIEVGEFINETPWKRWRKRESDPIRVKEEMSDLLAFFGSMLFILELWGITPEDIANAFVEKLQENRYRFSKENITTEGT